jgi:hypothetical protein
MRRMIPQSAGSGNFLGQVRMADLGAEFLAPTRPIASPQPRNCSIELPQVAKASFRQWAKE